MRLQLAKEWALEANFLVKLKRTKDITENDLVYLPEFVNWAITNQNWEMPLEFRALAKINEITNLPIKTKSEIQQWQLKPGKIYPGYRLALFEFLKQEFVSGKVDPPNAHDFIAKLKEDVANGIKPVNIFTKRYGIEYKIKTGESRNAELKSINQAIGNLIIKLSEDE